jgi:hypothetical protein
MRVRNARANGRGLALVVCENNVRERSFFIFKASTIKQSYHPDSLVKSCVKHTSAGSMKE